MAPGSKRPVRKSDPIGSFNRSSSSLNAGQTYLVSDSLSLADLTLVPVYDYLSQTPEGEKLLDEAPNLRAWWTRIKDRPSVVKTKPQLG